MDPDPYFNPVFGPDLCECGCGQTPNVYRKQRSRWIVGHHVRRPGPAFTVVESGCWEWNRSVDPSGYGVGRFGHEVRAHRAAYVYFVGPIPVDLCVLHRCDNRLCVNPGHLWLGTRDDNNKDRMRKGRSRPRRGDTHGSRKLSSDLVATIRSRYGAGESQMSLAREHGVSKNTVWNLINGRTWT